jgi:hypothetical protein
MCTARGSGRSALPWIMNVIGRNVPLSFLHVRTRTGATIENVTNS